MTIVTNDARCSESTRIELLYLDGWPTYLETERVSEGTTPQGETLPHAANIPMSATSSEVVEWMHHCIPSDS